MFDHLGHAHTPSLASLSCRLEKRVVTLYVVSSMKYADYEIGFFPKNLICICKIENPFKMDMQDSLGKRKRKGLVLILVCKQVLESDIGWVLDVIWAGTIRIVTMTLFLSR